MVADPFPKRTNEYSCLLDSFAYLLGVPQAILVKEIGHDGSQLVGSWHRAFHIQEFMPLMRKMGRMLSPIIIKPELEYPDGTIGEIKGSWWEECFGMEGIIEGRGVKHNHACVWDGISLLIRDPKGCTYHYKDAEHNNFTPEIVWRICRIK